MDEKPQTNEVYDDGQRKVLSAPIGGVSAGGAPTSYMVIRKTEGKPLIGMIGFQPAPIPDIGVHGWTNEALIAVVMDRLEHFQRGPFPCDEDAAALKYLTCALDALLREQA